MDALRLRLRRRCGSAARARRAAGRDARDARRGTERETVVARGAGVYRSPTSRSSTNSNSDVDPATRREHPRATRRRLRSTATPSVAFRMRRALTTDDAIRRTARRRATLARSLLADRDSSRSVRRRVGTHAATRARRRDRCPDSAAATRCASTRVPRKHLQRAERRNRGLRSDGDSAVGVRAVAEPGPTGTSARNSSTSMIATPDRARGAGFRTMTTGCHRSRARAPPRRRTRSDRAIASSRIADRLRSSPSECAAPSRARRRRSSSRRACRADAR